jgi:hypothetical protein
MRLILLCALLLSFSATSSAQTPGTRMTVDVSLNAIILRGDTTRVTYVLSNRPESQDSLMVFMVDAPARVSYIPVPQPDTTWMVDSLIHESEPAALWGKLDLLAPAASSIPILFESVGLPGIVTTWSQGSFPIPDCCDDDLPGTGEDVFITRTVQGKTVGVEAWPVDRSAQALLARLRTLTQSTCASPLLWITSSTLCVQLLSDIDAVEGFRASGAFSQAQNTMDHYNGLLTGPDPGTFASGVTSSAFWLLTSNANIVKAGLQ